jgi:hypothetical protein
MHKPYKDLKCSVISCQNHITEIHAEYRNSSTYAVLLPENLQQFLSNDPSPNKKERGQDRERKKEKELCHYHESISSMK